jgi:alkanesulfonate monooxygenase SsuD/methylene tetrahydromethanopterin reductase-like flavin-dependent oxidoreductase (luciferase family)
MAHDELYHNDENEVVKLSIQPGPYQTPRPPMWSMAESIPSNEWHASMGIGTMCQHLSVGRIRQNWERYAEVASATHGRRVEVGEDVAVMRTIYLAETDEEAIATAKPGIERLSKWASGNIYRMRQGLVTEDELEDGDMELDAFDFNMKHGLIIIGSPETAIRHIERLRDETGCRHVALFLNVPGLAFEQVKSCLRLFSERVMPRFAN